MKVNVVDEVPMFVQHTLRPLLLRVCQNKVNIGAYVSCREVHRLLLSFEHIVRKPVHPMRGSSRKGFTLIQEGWTFRRVAVDLNVCPSVIHRLWNRTMRHGGLDKVVDA